LEEDMPQEELPWLRRVFQRGLVPTQKEVQPEAVPEGISLLWQLRLSFTDDSIIMILSKFNKFHQPFVSVRL